MIEPLSSSEPVVLQPPSFGRQARSIAGYSLLTALMILARMPVFVPAALLHCAIRNGRRAAWAVLVLAVALAALCAAAVPMVARAETFGRVLLFLIAGSVVGLAATEVASRLVFSFSPFATD